MTLSSMSKAAGGAGTAMASGPPKIKRNASRKNKKSWRKNVDMTEVEKFMEEKAFDERIGGAISDKSDKDLFFVDTVQEDEKISKRKKRKERKPLKSLALLDGLPGAADPVGQRDRVRTAEERMNPIVKEKLEKLAKAGHMTKKQRQAAKNRQKYLDDRKATEEERKTRRRTKFNFDLWDDADANSSASAAKTDSKPPKAEADEWIDPSTVWHQKLGTSTYIASENKKNKVARNKSKLPAVEIPHPGASYNPSLADHRDLMWKAALVEIQKDKEEARVERATTGMFPTVANAPTEQTYIQEMSEGIPELMGQNSAPAEDNEESDDEKVVVAGKKGSDDEDQDDPKKKEVKKKTEKQLKKKRAKLFADQRLKSQRDLKLKETDVYRIKTFTKEINELEQQTKARQKVKANKAAAKLLQPAQLSNYKYEAPEEEVLLPEEMTSNLRGLRPQGSVLEDRFKSLQRRNIIETRVRHKTVHKLKRKRVEKRSYRMGWEENPNKLKKAAKMAAKKKKMAASKARGKQGAAK